MIIKVDSKETLNALAIVCRAALATGDLGIAKTAVVVIEAASVQEVKEEIKEEKPK